MACNAQFKLTIDGFKNQTDKAKDFVVFPHEGVPTKELYTKVLKFINETYRSPKNVINGVEPDMITIEGYQPSCISLDKPKKFLGERYSISGGYDIKYNVIVRIKDGRIRVDAPTFECTQINNGRTSRLVLTGSNGGLGTEVRVGLFKKNGNPSRECAISMIEDFFNTLCNGMEKSINDKVKEDW